jgi:hypothetical protein
VRRRWSNTRKTKRALIQQFLVCVASQAVTIDDFTSDVSTIARDAVALCKAEAHTAAVSNAGSHNELVPGFRASLEASGIETGIAALLKCRAATRQRPIPRTPASLSAKPKGVQI